MKDNLMKIEFESLTTVPYEDLSKWEVGKAVIKESINHWEPFGFLEGITNEAKKGILAIAYDNIAHDIIFEDERVMKIMERYNTNCNSKFTCEFETIVFPILRRVICGVVGRSDGAKMFSYKKFLDYLEDYSFLAINYDDYDRECDIEAEFCAILSSIIEEKFDNEKNFD